MSNHESRDGFLKLQVSSEESLKVYKDRTSFLNVRTIASRQIKISASLVSYETF